MQLERESPLCGQQWVSIHDKQLSNILCYENSVRFIFNDGFDLIENGQITRIGKGYIELKGCNSDDFSCHVIKRKTTKKGSKLFGKPITLEELSGILSDKRKTIEIYVELYDTNRFYWRGELHPYKKLFGKELSPLVTIETMDFYPMVYSWE